MKGQGEVKKKNYHKEALKLEYLLLSNDKPFSNSIVVKHSNLFLSGYNLFLTNWFIGKVGIMRSEVSSGRPNYNLCSKNKIKFCTSTLTSINYCTET